MIGAKEPSDAATQRTSHTRRRSRPAAGRGCSKSHSTDPPERLNKQVKRRADVVGIFPNEARITRLIGAVPLEQNDEWLLRHRYRQIDGMAEPTSPLIDAEPAKPMAA